MVTERFTVRPLQVMVAVPDMSAYTIEFKDTSEAYLTQVVSAHVPIDKAGQLKEDDIRAYIEVKNEYLPANALGLGTPETGTDEGRWIDGPVQFQFPPGFEDVVIDWQQQETVAFRVKRTSKAGNLPAVNTP
jgi:hypothetical protein